MVTSSLISWSACWLLWADILACTSVHLLAVISTAPTAPCLPSGIYNCSSVIPQFMLGCPLKSTRLLYHVVLCPSLLTNLFPSSLVPFWGSPFASLDFCTSSHEACGRHFLGCPQSLALSTRKGSSVSVEVKCKEATLVVLSISSLSHLNPISNPEWFPPSLPSSD